MLIGREPDAAVLGEASAWQLARSVSRASADPRLVEIDASLDRVTGGGARAQPRAGRERRRQPRRAGVRARLPRHGGPADRGAPQAHRFQSFTDALGVVGGAPAAPRARRRVRRGQARTRLRGVLRPGRARARDLRAAPEVAGLHRERYRTVLLDEYQDTSVVQTRLLAALFRGHPVMAVGDPDQSIYGWRGASAANLARFGRDFADAGHRRRRVRPLDELAQPGVVLDAANAIIAPLDAASRRRRSSPSPFAGAGRLDVGWARDHRRGGRRRRLVRRAARRPGRPRRRSGALLCRTFAHVDLFTAALRAAGVPVHVLGVAGLLDQPVIADLVCTLRVLHDPSAGSELLRVLGGARWRIGPADLAALGGLARWLADRDLGSSGSPTTCDRACAGRSRPTSRRRSSTRSTSSSPRPTGTPRCAGSPRSASPACAAPERSSSRSAGGRGSASSTS